MIPNISVIASATQFNENDVAKTITVLLTDGTPVFVPVDDMNSDYQLYLQWVNAGNIPSIDDYTV